MLPRTTTAWRMNNTTGSRADERPNTFVTGRGGSMT
jgi:hypothetical protein